MVMMACFSAQAWAGKASELQRGNALTLHVGNALRQASDVRDVKLLSLSLSGRCFQEVDVLDSVCLMQLYYTLHAHVMCT